jgi:thiol:disulfide interchange protein
MKIVRNLVVAFAVTLSGIAAHAADIYPSNADAKHDIHEALVKAKAEHKRVILDLGGNWCGDCQVLNQYFHQAPNDKLIAQNYIVVPVNIGRYDMNTDVAEKYGVNLKKGVPELVVLSPDEQVLNGMTMSAFESMRKMDPSTVTDFLNQWKPDLPSRR